LNSGRLIVISGPSGVGKTTLCQHILKSRADIWFSISATSRPRRQGEADGREYIFLTREKFQDWINKGDFIEHAVVHGNYYGTPRKPLENRLEKGQHVLLDVDVQGAKNLMELYPDGIYIFLIPPDLVELEQRLLKRKTEADKAIKDRLLRAQEEMAYRHDYKYVIENNDLGETVNRILQILDQEIGD
jgi:guanylate kinase